MIWFCSLGLSYVSFGGSVGTELCSEAIENLEKKYDVVLNIQGDEQLIEPEIIDSIVKALHVLL